MKVQVRTQDNNTIIECTGEVDLYTSPKLREALLKEMAGAQTNVLINMSGVSYIDSSGIATLVEGLQLSQRTQTRFGLFGLRSNAKSVLELARLTKVFSIFENEQDALEKIGKTSPFSGLA
jgi:anti-sigma B factor antagonist